MFLFLWIKIQSKDPSIQVCSVITDSGQHTNMAKNLQEPVTYQSYKRNT